MKPQLRPSDLVEIKKMNEILQTLDPNGTLDGLPFMPEMLAYCGGKYRVSQRVVQATLDGIAVPDYAESYLREFKDNDVLLLEELRCSGLEHDGCQRGCRILWKEAWLKNVEGVESPSGPPAEDLDRVRSQLKTSAKPGFYFCQSSEFYKATHHLSARQRLGKIFEEVRAGNCTGVGMMKRLLIWSWWKGRRKLLGDYPRGDCHQTPVEVLNLQPGELVEVKPLAEIVKTLDKQGKNRGLHFSPDMIPFIGRRYRVRSRADKLIAEVTGKMESFPNTVILEDVTCDSAYYAFGGSPRNEFQYWREIWLKRVEEKDKG